jgi:hypothetical protein
MHGAPQLGVASETGVSGNSVSSPTSGPRRYQGRGHAVMPTRKPISSRAVYQPQTATSPRI